MSLSANDSFCLIDTPVSAAMPALVIISCAVSCLSTEPHRNKFTSTTRAGSTRNRFHVCYHQSDCAWRSRHADMIPSDYSCPQCHPRHDSVVSPQLWVFVTVSCSSYSSLLLSSLCLGRRLAGGILKHRVLYLLLAGGDYM